MKKLTDAEYDGLLIRGKGRSSHLFNSLVNLKVGESILIEPKDWNRKASPTTLVKYIEKNHEMKFTCGSVINGEGWVVKRVENLNKKNIQKSKKEKEKEISDSHRQQLKSDIVIFYLGRIVSFKIERIEDSIKATIKHFWKEDKKTIEELFYEMIKRLEEQGSIVIDNERSYIPLGRK